MQALYFAVAAGSRNMSVAAAASIALAAFILSAKGITGSELFNANVVEIAQCNGPDAPTELKDFVVDRVEGNNFEMNGTLIVKEDIPGPINVSCIIDRCMSEDKPDSCEYHTTFKLENFCEEISKPNKPWSDFLDRIRIKKKCPLEKGVYYVKKYRMSLNVLQPLALSRPFRVFWKMTTRLDSPKFSNAFCMRDVCSLEPKNKLKRRRNKET